MRAFIWRSFKSSVWRVPVSGASWVFSVGVGFCGVDFDRSQRGNAQAWMSGPSIRRRQHRPSGAAPAARSPAKAAAGDAHVEMAALHARRRGRRAGLSSINSSSGGMQRGSSAARRRSTRGLTSGAHWPSVAASWSAQPEHQPSANTRASADRAVQLEGDPVALRCDVVAPPTELSGAEREIEHDQAQRRRSHCAALRLHVLAHDPLRSSSRSPKKWPPRNAAAISQ